MRKPTRAARKAERGRSPTETKQARLKLSTFRVEPKSVTEWTRRELEGLSREARLVVPTPRDFDVDGRREGTENGCKLCCAISSNRTSRQRGIEISQLDWTAFS